MNGETTAEPSRRCCTRAILALTLLLTLALPQTARTADSITRGPYLQAGTDTHVTIRWRTAPASDSLVVYGLESGNLDQSLSDAATVTDHAIKLTGLVPETRYYYAVGTSTELLTDVVQPPSFVTAPTPGPSSSMRIWAIGDSGTADANAAAVRDAYLSTLGAERDTDIWLMLGDNAYTDGTDAQYQAAVFDMYPGVLASTVLWPTLGNHDGISADSATQSGPYYDIFSLPTAGEAGGVSSFTEAYYSFDRGNIHFICLDSHESNRAPDGPMLTWLVDDLLATNAAWIIAFWHHPPYTKGSHDSDAEARLIQMRENALPLLEAYGVDLVLAGHSHSYERSVLLDQHYGSSETLAPIHFVDGGDGRLDGAGAYAKNLSEASNSGAVYVVAGSSGKTSGGSLDHPTMLVALNVLGSLVIDIDATVLTARFVNASGIVADYFTIDKTCGDGVVDPTEDCDDAGESPSCDADCTVVSCGDGIVNATVGEECDDGATVSGDGCSSTCTCDGGVSGTECSWCGNGVCDSSFENCQAGPRDCWAGSGTICGDGLCEVAGGENCTSCAQDCNGKQNGKPSRRFCCGDGLTGDGAVTCSDPRCTAAPYACTEAAVEPSCCGDGVCDLDENSYACAIDCGAIPLCGDGTCQGAESACDCPVDCGAPPASEADCSNAADDDCDGSVDCADGDCSPGPDCSCQASGTSCTSDMECCSGKCKGKRGQRTCN